MGSPRVLESSSPPRVFLPLPELSTSRVLESSVSCSWAGHNIDTSFLYSVDFGQLKLYSSVSSASASTSVLVGGCLVCAVCVCVPATRSCHTQLALTCLWFAYTTISARPCRSHP